MNCLICRSSRFIQSHKIGEYQCLRCLNCDLEFLSPLPSEKVLSEIYSSDYYHCWQRNASLQLVDELKKRTFENYLKNICKYRVGGKFLDVGCATGSMLSAAKKRGFDVYGLDINPKAIEYCRSITINVVQGELIHQSYPSDFFDVIILSDVLEHIIDVTSFISELKRILKTNGILFVVVPNTRSITRRILGTNWPHYKIEHLYYYNGCHLKELFKDFEIKGIKRSSKAMSFSYFGNVLSHYTPNKLIRIFGATLSYLERFLNFHFFLSTGEIQMIAQKSSNSIIRPSTQPISR